MKKLKQNKFQNYRRNGVMRFVDESFAKMLDETKKTRITIEKDNPNNVVADWRITLAMTRHPLTKEIMKDIINADLN
jgi:DNA-binding XRE family transcriptional regulator